MRRATLSVRGFAPATSPKGEGLLLRSTEKRLSLWESWRSRLRGLLAALALCCALACSGCMAAAVSAPAPPPEAASNIAAQAAPTPPSDTAGGSANLDSLPSAKTPPSDSMLTPSDTAGGSANPSPLPSAKTLTCRYYEEKGFLRAVENAAPYAVQGPLLAGISPHFLPAMSYTANLLLTLQQAGVEDPTIWVLAPNHSGQGLPLLVADRGWSTPFGQLDADEEATTALLNSSALAGEISVDLPRIEADHSAATLMPFIKYYLPKARVVTVLLTKGAPLTDLQALAALIHESARDKQVFLLASTDFSHYLPIEETAQRDRQTEQLLAAQDIAALKALDSGNTDSPETLVTLLSYVGYFPQAQATLCASKILPESAQKPNIGYSYKAYLFSDAQ